jgi:hypothetical protein
MFSLDLLCAAAVGGEREVFGDVPENEMNSNGRGCP